MENCERVSFKGLRDSMEISLTQWLVVSGILLIVGIIADGFRRMRVARKRSTELNFGLEEVRGYNEAFSSELPNGGARSTRMNEAGHKRTHKDAPRERAEPDFSSSQFDDSLGQEGLYDAHDYPDDEEAYHEPPTLETEVVAQEPPVVEPEVESAEVRDKRALDLEEPVPVLMNLEEPLADRAFSADSKLFVDNELSADREPPVVKEPVFDPEPVSTDNESLHPEESRHARAPSFKAESLQESINDSGFSKIYPEASIRPGTSAPSRQRAAARGQARNKEHHEPAEHAAQRSVRTEGALNRETPLRTPRAEKLSERPPAAEVIVINVLARGGGSFDGAQLMQSLLASGMRYGDMSIFHRYANADGTGSILFSMANGVKPGTFDLDRLETTETPALSFFLGLPGPEKPVQAFTMMEETARRLALDLGGELKDEHFSVMTQQTLEHCRQRIREYERKQLANKPLV